MGVEALDGAEGFNMGQRGAQGVLVEHDDAGAALELIRCKACEGPAGPACGKLVTRPRQKVAPDYRRQAAEKNGARGAELQGNFARCIGGDRDMLGGVFVRNPNGLLHVLDKDEFGVFERLGEFGGTLGKLRLPLNGLFDTSENFFGIRDQNRLAAVAVLGLGQKIGRDPIGLGCLVGDHKHLAWAGQEVDGDFAEDLALGFHDIGIAWAENFLHGKNRLRAMGQCGDGLGSADSINLCRAAAGKSCQQGGMHFAIRPGGSHRDDLRHASSLGKRAGHHSGGHQRRRAAGNINADALEGVESFTGDRSLPVFHKPALAQAALGKRLHIRARGVDRLARFRRKRITSLGNLQGSNGDLVWRDIRAAEFLRVAEQRLVAFLGYRAEDFFHSRTNSGIRFVGAFQRFNAAPVGFVFRTENLHRALVI